MKERRRVISILLMITLMFSSFVAFSFAETGDGIDEESDTEETLIFDCVPDKTDEELGISSAGKKLDGTYRTILIAGIDNVNHSDVIMIFSYNKKNSESKVYTVSRDAYMQISDKVAYEIDGKVREFTKCNRAYENGDKYLMMRELNRHLDLNIREFIGVSWDCAAKLVNKLNGMGYQVTGNIESQEMLNAINRAKPIEAALTKTGSAVPLRGWQAVQYLRVRNYTGGSPIARDLRNQAFFSQLFGYAKKMKFEEALNVYNEIEKDLDTNMSPAVLKGTIALIAVSDWTKHVTISSFQNWPYKKVMMWDSDEKLNYYVPVSLLSNTTDLHKTVYKEAYTPSTVVKSLSSRIDARRKSNELKYNLNNAIISISDVTYNGKSQKPKVTVTINDVVLSEGVNYTVANLKNNKKIGTASLSIKGKGNTDSFAYNNNARQTVTQNKTFTVRPKGTSLSKLTASKKAFTVKWKKQAGKMPKSRVTGYQIQYSTNSKFSSGVKTKTVKGYSKTSKKISKLKAKKNYYVRIRTYIKVGNKKYYSAWSKTKKIKTKK